MKFKLVIFSIVLLLSASAAFGQTLTSTFFSTNNEYKIEITEADLKNTPSWIPENEEIVPLSFNEAIEIGRETVKRYIPTADNKWRLSGVMLYRMGKDKWLYSVSFHCSQNCNGESGNFSVYIKMDGTIIEPTVTPRDKISK